MNFSGCYLLQLNADQGTNKYKIGQSKNIAQRLRAVEYRNATIYEAIEVLRYQSCEREIVTIFREKFENVRKDVSGGYGLEYFRGDLEEMRKIFKETCAKYNIREEISQKLIQSQNTNKVQINQSIASVFSIDECYEKALHEDEIKVDVELKIEHDSEDPILVFSSGKYKIEKHANYDMFYLRSVEDIVHTYNPSIGSVKTFLRSNQFYQMLCAHDESLPKYGFVYLLINKSNKTFKIGKTFDFPKRYSEAKRELKDQLIPVYDCKAVENDLIHFFSNYYEKVSGTDETFKYDNYKDVRKEFLTLVSTKRVELDYMQSTHIQKIYMSDSRKGLWLSRIAAGLMLSYYIEEPDERKNLHSMMQLIETHMENDVYQFIQYDTKYKTNVLYWKFHKYTVIQREDNLYVNGSRLYNSICRTDGKKKKYASFKKFMTSGRMAHNINDFNVLYPDKEPMVWQDNKENKYLEGYYVHYLFVHFIVEYLNSEYAFFVADLMFKTFNPSFKPEKIQKLYPIEEPSFRGTMTMRSLAMLAMKFRGRI